MPSLTTITLGPALAANSKALEQQSPIRIAEVLPPQAVQQAASRELAERGTKVPIPDKKRTVQREKRSEGAFSDQEKHTEQDHEETGEPRKGGSRKLNRVA